MNSRNIPLVLIVILSIAALSGCVHGSTVNNVHLTVNPLFLTASNSKLKITIINNSSQDVVTYSDFFHSTLFKLKAISLDSDKVLTQFREVGAHGRILLPPNGSYSRTLDLNKHFPELANVVMNHNVLISWNAHVRVNVKGKNSSFYVSANGSKVIYKDSNGHHINNIEPRA